MVRSIFSFNKSYLLLSLLFTATMCFFQVFLICHKMEQVAELRPQPPAADIRSARFASPRSRSFVSFNLAATPASVTSVRVRSIKGKESVPFAGKTLHLSGRYFSTDNYHHSKTHLFIQTKQRSNQCIPRNLVTSPIQSYTHFIWSMILERNSFENRKWLFL